RVLGRELTPQLRVEHHGAGAGVPPLDLRILVEERPETTPHLFALSLSPHDAPHGCRFVGREESKGDTNVPSCGSLQRERSPHGGGSLETGEDRWDLGTPATLCRVTGEVHESERDCYRAGQSPAPAASWSGAGPAPDVTGR